MSDDISAPMTMDAPAASVPKRGRIWFPLILVAIYWILRYALLYTDLPTFLRFAIPAGWVALSTLAILIWWLIQRRVSFNARIMTLLAAVGFAYGASQLAHKSLEPVAFVLTGLPVAVTAWAVWLTLASSAPRKVFLGGSIAVLALAWVPFLFVRMEGLTGGVAADLHWRWSKTAEEMFLAEHAKSSASKPKVVDGGKAVTEQPGDWVAFRGPNRDGIIRGTQILADWNANPPKKIWRQRTGAGWSSIIIVDGKLYTQEQRGEMEVVVCLDAATGNEIWVHENKTRYLDFQSGAGPRGTPGFARGTVVALGANGALDCLDAATGDVKWTRNVVADAGSKVPQWGVSGSPLILNDLVIVYTGDNGENLRAYKFEDGKPAWSAKSGDFSYVSPQPATIQGVPQVLHFANNGLTSYESATGKVLWQRETPAKGGVWRAVQPHVFNDSVLVSSDDFGTRMFDITFAGKDRKEWGVGERSYDLKLRAYFNDYAIHGGLIYGFDTGTFACVDLTSGKRLWKGGSYGSGQMLLLADQNLIIVLTERGQAVLLKATPEKHEELGSFEAIEGKTWNHPTLVNGRLYVRNGEEMGCYEVGK